LPRTSGLASGITKDAILRISARNFTKYLSVFSKFSTEMKFAPELKMQTPVPLSELVGRIDGQYLVTISSTRIRGEEKKMNNN
jgi:hypothetical protein